MLYVIYLFFFKQKTAYEMRISDWSSDVCSSDLMGDARSIVMVQIGPDQGRVSAEDALCYMSRHGVHGELRRVERGHEAPEEILEEMAKDIAPGLIIMGAFGRPRLRETLFGGVTRYLLEAAPAPLLLAHCSICARSRSWRCRSGRVWRQRPAGRAGGRRTVNDCFSCIVRNRVICTSLRPEALLLLGKMGRRRRVASGNNLSLERRDRKSTRLHSSH